MKQRQNAPVNHAEREPLQAAALSSAASVRSESFGASTEANNSPRQLAQGALMTQLMAGPSPASTAPAAAAGPGATVQLKGRIDLSKIDDEEKRKRIEVLIKQAREQRIADKQVARQTWLPDRHKDQADTMDSAYNSSMEAARKKYGLTIRGLKEKEGLSDEQYLDGERYYGAEEDGVFKRPDNGKHYVKGHNGVFMSRFVRRELNQYDIAALGPDDARKDLSSTGISTHSQVDIGRKKPRLYGDGGKLGQDLGTPEREFLQQSYGGGGNQFAFSHTATQHPILSNDHLNFGVKGRKDTNTTPHARIVTDLSKLNPEHRRAQWAMAPEEEGGHIIRRPETDFDEEWMKARRSKVIQSGYRNKEVLSSTIPAEAVVAIENGWETGDYTGGVSAAGQWFGGIKKDKEKGI
ncbi:hypothetical protein [Roseateles sp. PN1]|uniref:hypothetical protein n=1 Tax=Roseateles sp. PN1 TaxID=3137372 RepID=UPI003139667B